MKLVHWPLIGGLYIWYNEEGPGRATAPTSPHLAVPNVTAHPSTASVPITAEMTMGQWVTGQVGQQIRVGHVGHGSVLVTR